MTNEQLYILLNGIARGIENLVAETRDELEGYEIPRREKIHLGNFMNSLTNGMEGLDRSTRGGSDFPIALDSLVSFQIELKSKANVLIGKEEVQE